MFGFVYFSSSSWLISKKQKGHRANLVYFCPKSLLISEKKKVILPNLFYLSRSFLAVSKKKNYILKLPQEGHAGHFRGAEFLFRGAPPPFPTVLVALLIRICPEHDNLSSRSKISTALQCRTILLSYAKCFVSILLQSVVLNLL